MLENELKLTCKEFEEGDIRALLKESNKECTPRETIQGYPSYPLYREIGNMLQQWMEKRYIHYIPHYALNMLNGQRTLFLPSNPILSFIYPCDQKWLYEREYGGRLLGHVDFLWVLWLPLTSLISSN